MGIRKEKKEKRRQDILEAALDLFVTKGYMETKVSDISEKVGMSTGLLFHYFSSKEQLYTELVRIGLEATRKPSKENYSDAIKYFEIFIRQLFEMMRIKPSIAKMFVLMAQAQKREGTPEEVHKLAIQVSTIDEFIPYVEQGQREGSIRAGDARILSMTFWCSIQGIAELYAMHPEMGLPEEEWILDIIRGGRR